VNEMSENSRHTNSELITQRDFNSVILQLAGANYEMLVRALVSLEGGTLTEHQYTRWLKGDAGLLNDNLQFEQK
jgi:hypothetical protein